MLDHNLEIEAKYIHIDLIDIRQKLEESNFELVYPEYSVFRATFICHDPHMTLRVREEYGQTTMTYKYRDPTKAGALGTEEVEIVVDDFDKAVHILEKAHKPKKVLRQESRRELWSDGENEVCIDEWPGTGKYIEIESPSEEELIRVSEHL
jgi:predicted adenylyl cyclase CyaB